MFHIWDSDHVPQKLARCMSGLNSLMSKQGKSSYLCSKSPLLEIPTDLSYAGNML